MGEALGIDLRGAVCAAARRRGELVEPCLLGAGAATVPAIDLVPIGAGGGGDAVATPAAQLSAIAARAVGDDPVDAVAVTYPLTPDDGPRMQAEQAASAAFGDAFIVSRPVAAAARFLHDNDRGHGVVLAVLDMDVTSVDVALVRRRQDGFEIPGQPAAWMSAGGDVDMAVQLDGAVTVLESVIAGAGLTVGDVDTALLVGASEWLPQLAVQTRVATGLTVVVDPEPDVAAALGAALLAGGPDRRGLRRAAAGPALVGPAPCVPAPTTTTGAGAGAAVGQISGAPSGEVGSGLGLMLHDAAGPGDGLGEVTGDILVDEGSGAATDRLTDPPKRPPGRGLGSAADGPFGEPAVRSLGEPADEPFGDLAGGPLGEPADGPLGESVGLPAGATPGGAPGRVAGRGRRRTIAGVVAALAAFLVVAGALRALDGGSASDAVETDEAIATTEQPSASRPGSTNRSASTGPASTATGAPATTVVAGDPAPPPSTPGAAVGPAVPVPIGSTPGAPPAPGDPPPTTGTTQPADTTPPSVSGLARTDADIDEDGPGSCTLPMTTQLSAIVSDPSGVQGVTASWTGNGIDGSVAMTSAGGAWQATIGPIGDSALTEGESATITWSVQAVDNAGNIRTSGAGPSITLHGC